MSEIIYSSEALNVLNKFHRADIAVHVEGDDDIVFWKEVFKQFSNKKVEFIPSGGSPELDRRIGLIEAGLLNAFAARDSDYLVLRGASSTSPRILYSYGYSIENTLYCELSVATLAMLASRTNDDFLPVTKDWRSVFANAFFPLLRLDLANDIGGTGISVLGDNCSRYMENDSSKNPCPAKIGAKAIKSTSQLDTGSIAAADNIINKRGLEPWRWLRGHFIASGVQKFISNSVKGTGRRVSVAHEHIFCQAVLCVHQVLSNDIEQRSYYQKSITNACAIF